MILATGYAPKLGESAEYLPLADGRRLQANHYTGRTPERGVFAAGDAVTGAQSVIHAVASGKRTALAVDAWLRGDDLATLEEELAAYAGLPYLEQLKDARRARRRSAGVWPSAPRVAQDGRAAPSPRLAPRCPRSASSSASRPRTSRSRRATPSPPPRPRPSAACSATCPSLGTCDLQTLGVEYGITDNDLVVKGSRVRAVRAPARASLHPARHGALHRLRPLRARLPRRGRPGLLRLHRPRLHHQRRHAVRRGPAAGRLHHLRPLRHAPAPPARSPSTSASCQLVQGRREPLHHVPGVRQRLPGRRPRGDQPLRGRPPEVAGAGRPGQPAGRRPPHVRRLRRAHRGAPGAHGHQRPGGVSAPPPAASR